VEICIHHLGLFWCDIDDNWNLVQDREWKQLNEDDYQVLMNGCKQCRTEFRIDFKDLGDNGSALFVTRWQDLGKGRSVFDPVWQAHIYHPGGYELGKAEYEVGSIATGFEETDISNFDFDGVTTREERRKLCEQENTHHYCSCWRWREISSWDACPTIRSIYWEIGTSDRR
jgi:hypothetical protein